jgi:hypothetical protein
MTVDLWAAVTTQDEGILDAGDEKPPYVRTIGRPRRTLSRSVVTAEPLAAPRPTS